MMSMPNYISNKELTAEILICQKTNIVSDKLARMLMMLVERLSYKSNWRSYSYRDEMISDALYHLVTCAHKSKTNVPPVLRFDIGYSEKSGTAPNPFSFLTTTINNCFRRRLETEKREHGKRDDLLVHHGLQPSFSYQQDVHDQWEAETGKVQTERKKPGPKPVIKKKPVEQIPKERKKPGPKPGTKKKPVEQTIPKERKKPGRKPGTKNKPRTLTP